MRAHGEYNYRFSMTPDEVQVGDRTVINKVNHNANYYTHTHAAVDNNGPNDCDLSVSRIIKIVINI